MWQAREAHTRSPAHDDMVFQEGAFQHQRMIACCRRCSQNPTNMYIIKLTLDRILCYIYAAMLLWTYKYHTKLQKSAFFCLRLTFFPYSQSPFGMSRGRDHPGLPREFYLKYGPDLNGSIVQNTSRRTRWESQYSELRVPTCLVGTLCMGLMDSWTLWIWR